MEIFSLLDRMAPPGPFSATPSQALSISDLASCPYWPERCVAVRADGVGDLASAAQVRLLHAQAGSPGGSARRRPLLGASGQARRTIELDSDMSPCW